MPKNLAETGVRAVLAEIRDQSVAIDKPHRHVPGMDLDPGELEHLEFFIHAPITTPVPLAAIAALADDLEAETLDRTNNFHRMPSSGRTPPVRRQFKEARKRLSGVLGS